MAALFDSYDKSYDTVVQSSIDFSGLPHSFFMTAKVEVLRDLVAGHFGPGYQMEALDVGCGVGAFHPYVRGLFRRLCGTDVSAASIARARQDNPEVEYQAYDGQVLPYGEASFDLASAICVMHHVPPPQWLGFLREIRRVVRPGGLVCVIEHNPLNPLTRLAVARCEFDRDAVLLRAGRVQQLMMDASLREASTRYFAVLPRATALTRRIEQSLRQVPLGAQYLTSGVV
jgi:SAM-dependent methyltransferase